MAELVAMFVVMAVASVVSAGGNGRGRPVDVSLRRRRQPVLIDLDVDGDGGGARVGGGLPLLLRQVGPNVTLQEAHPVEGLRKEDDGYIVKGRYLRL